MCQDAEDSHAPKRRRSPECAEQDSASYIGLGTLECRTNTLAQLVNEEVLTLGTPRCAAVLLCDVARRRKTRPASHTSLGNENHPWLYLDSATATQLRLSQQSFGEWGYAKE